MAIEGDAWPSLPLEKWEGTYETLRLWFQIVGKIRLSQTPWINHSWHVPLYVTTRGLTTSPIPYGTRALRLTSISSAPALDSGHDGLSASSRSDRNRIEVLRGVAWRIGRAWPRVTIHGTPNEVEGRSHLPTTTTTLPMTWSTRTASACSWYRRTGCSNDSAQFHRRQPVHFFWGSCTSSGHALLGPSGNSSSGRIVNCLTGSFAGVFARVSSAGFWPGGGPHAFPLFYTMHIRNRTASIR